jgi:hypothetical protein
MKYTPPARESDSTTQDGYADDAFGVFGPSLESLQEKRQSFPGERSRKLQTRRIGKTWGRIQIPFSDDRAGWGNKFVPVCLARGDTVSTCPSPLNVLRYEYDHSCDRARYSDEYQYLMKDSPTAIGLRGERAGGGQVRAAARGEPRRRVRDRDRPHEARARGRPRQVRGGQGL